MLDINPGSDHSSPGEFTPLNGLLLFTAETAADGRELWFTDGTGVGTQMVLDIYPGPEDGNVYNCLLYTSPSPRDRQKSRMPSSA